MKSWQELNVLKQLHVISFFIAYKDVKEVYMLKNKRIKIFLMFAVLLFNLVGGVGCVSATDKQSGGNALFSGNSDITQSSTTDDLNNSENDEENNDNADDDHITGPGGMCPFVDCWSSNFTSFQNAFTKYDNTNYFFIAFDFDNLPPGIIGKKTYFYSTLRDGTVFDPNYVYPSKYVFCSFVHPIGSGLDSTTFTIECEEIALIEGCTDYEVVFEFVKEEDTILSYNLLLDGNCVMKISIDMEENYTSEEAESVVSLLKNNIKIIKIGGF